MAFLPVVLMACPAGKQGTFANQLNKKEETAYIRAVVRRVSLISFTHTRPNGERWDNAWSGYDPDIFLEIKDLATGATLFENIKARKENAVPGSQISFSPGTELNALTHNYSVTFIDYDSMTGYDIVSTAIFCPQSHAGSQFLTLNKGGSEIRLELEWIR